MTVNEEGNSSFTGATGTDPGYTMRLGLDGSITPSTITMFSELLSFGSAPTGTSRCR
jgi:hypothetical protein